MANRIVVDLSRQILYAYQDGTLVFEYSCVSGDNDNPTTVGRHRVIRKHRIYRSRKYDRQMNFAMFFHGGEAIHESNAVGPMSYARTFLRAVGLGEEDPFGSHGCVRLSSDHAETLFDWTPMQTPVDVARSFDPATGAARY
jgi:lipoprotein-anchoring transpeptidase ErfK/SrfK